MPCGYRARTIWQKDSAALQTITQKNINFLQDHGATDIVLACNSASAIKSSLCCGAPVFDVVQPICNTYNKESVGKLVVLCTDATKNSEVYRARITTPAQITHIALSDLATCIDTNQSEAVVYTYLQKELMGDRTLMSIIEDADAVILGCTHYPFFMNVFKQLLPNKILDPSVFLAAELLECGVLRKEKSQLRIHFTSKNAHLHTYAQSVFPNARITCE